MTTSARWGAALLAFYFLCGVPQRACAGEDEGALQPIVDPDTEVAERLFRVGSDLYARGKYLDAAEAFLQASRARPVPALDYNIARAYDRAGRWEEAIDAYQRFLVSKPPNASTIEARITELSKRVQASPLSQRAAATRPVYKKAWFWVVLVASVGAAGAGVGLGLHYGLHPSPAPSSSLGNFTVSF